MTQPKGHFPDLREFVKDCEQKLNDFCHYMLGENRKIDEVVLSIFREFGDYYRNVAAKQPESVGATELRIGLFRLAWTKIRDQSQAPVLRWSGGRDPRALKGWDANLLSPSADRTSLQWQNAVKERFGLLDPDFRAPVILKDVLRFEDEEAIRILGLRWGVFRHRLHRGRLDFRECLLGNRAAGEGPGIGQPVLIRT